MKRDFCLALSDHSASWLFAVTYLLTDVTKHRMLSVVGVMCCNELFQQRKRRRQSTTSSITKLRYTTAKTFDEDVRRAWRQQSGSDGQVEDTEEADAGAVWQSQSQSQRRQRGHDNCDCARCRCRPKPDNSNTSSALYVTKPPLYWPHRTTHVADPTDRRASLLSLLSIAGVWIWQWKM